MGKDFDDAREELDKIEKQMRKIRKKQIMLIDRIEAIYDDFKRVDVSIGKRSILSVEYADRASRDCWSWTKSAIENTRDVIGDR